MQGVAPNEKSAEQEIKRAAPVVCYTLIRSHSLHIHTICRDPGTSFRMFVSHTENGVSYYERRETTPYGLLRFSNDEIASLAMLGTRWIETARAMYRYDAAKAAIKLRQELSREDPGSFLFCLLSLASISCLLSFASYLLSLLLSCQIRMKMAAGGAGTGRSWS